MIVQSKKVFIPNATSDLLAESAVKFIKKKSSILDLGCGTGFVGLTIHKYTRFINNYYFSDISLKAIKLCKKNAKKNNIKIVAKVGGIFKPWKNKKFDIIVESVSGIAKKVADISPWYKNNIPCNCGNDGTLLVSKVLKESKKHLNKNGKIFFPIVSFSDKARILKDAKKYFLRVKLIASKDWPLPKSMYSSFKLLNKLKKIGIINFKTKYGLILYTTDIYMAY